MTHSKSSVGARLTFYFLFIVLYTSLSRSHLFSLWFSWKLKLGTGLFSFSERSSSQTVYDTTACCSATYALFPTVSFWFVCVSAVQCEKLLLATTLLLKTYQSWEVLYMIRCEWTIAELRERLVAKRTPCDNYLSLRSVAKISCMVLKIWWLLERLISFLSRKTPLSSLW